MAEVLTFGEPMGLFVAETVCPLKDAAHFTRYVCGAEVNFSIGMARLGHTVSYLSRVGDDPLGLHIVEFLKRNGVFTDDIQMDSRQRTGLQLKAKVHEGDPEVVNFRRGSAFSFFEKNELKHVSWQGVRHLHVTGIPPALSMSCRESIFSLMRMAKEGHITVSFDPNLRPSLWDTEKEMREVIQEMAALSDICLPGIGEGKFLTGKQSPEEIAAVYQELGNRMVIIKLGAEGAFVRQGEKSFCVPGYHVERVVDTVGAGDGFAVGCISALLEGMDVRGAVLRGAAVGAMAVMSEGDNEGLPEREALEAFQTVAGKG